MVVIIGRGCPRYLRPADTKRKLELSITRGTEFSACSGTSVKLPETKFQQQRAVINAELKPTSRSLPLHPYVSCFLSGRYGPTLTDPESPMMVLPLLLQFSLTRTSPL